MAVKFANSSWAFEMPKNKPAPTTATLGRPTASGVTPNTLLQTVTSGKPAPSVNAVVAQRNQDITNASKAEPVYTTPSAGSGTVAVNSAINDLKSMYAAELAKREKEAAERQAQLAAQQLALKNQRDAEINAAYNNSKNLLGTEKDNALAKAYTAYMQGRKNMPQIAAVGGNGGIAQSILAKQQLNYENNRNAVEQKYLEDLMQLDANKNAGLTASTEAYTTGLMGLQSNSQNYLDNLRALQNDVTGYAGQMETLLNKLNNKVTTATATPKLTGYKVGGKTMSKEEYLAYLANLGMNAEEAYDFMKNNNILY